ncbi:M23 family metallopeptidase [Microbacterium sp. gxy059]|uniref:M23 family metallopeptidase n=1 Tax=Microbacterium sp. gxy059 TaxID=2957199 RepID=UPI003D96DC93
MKPIDDAPDAAVPCDCAPTREEKKALWGSVSRRSALAAGAIGVLGLGVYGSLRSPGSAWAVSYDPADYPTWEDVERARGNQSAKAGEIRRIEGYIADLKNRVAAAQEAARIAGEEYYEAQQDFYEASFRAEELQQQADDESTKADEAAQAAAKVASSLARTGGESTPYEVLFADSAANADELLAKLGQMDKLASRNESIYAAAVAARDSAQHLSDQAEEARKERDRLQKIAEQKLQEAQAAQAAAEQALADQETHLVTLEQQLAALRDTTSKTVEEYREGVAARKAYEEEQRRLEEERRRKAAEEAERRAREEEERRRREQSQNPGGGGTPAAPAPNPQPSQPAPNPGGGGSGSGGWTHPHSGAVITSGYGYRNQICGPSYCSTSLHAGTDLAAGCGSAIVAANSGTVTYAGYNGGYGNYVRIEHGGGIGTGYAHIVDGGIAVGYGQQVSAGQVIAYEGNTGNSFGCHLHFEVYVGGPTVDPVPFMADRGIYL